MELPPSFLRDMVAAVHGVGILGTKEPSQAEACPHTAAITRDCEQKKSARNRDLGAVAPLSFPGFLRPFAEFAATGRQYIWKRTDAIVINANPPARRAFPDESHQSGR